MRQLNAILSSSITNTDVPAVTEAAKGGEAQHLLRNNPKAEYIRKSNYKKGN